MSAQIAAPYGEKSLTEAVVRKCPFCEAEISLEVGTENTDLRTCPDCGVELEVFFDPSKIKLSAIEQDYPEFDTGNIDLTASPTLAPAPGEKEDWGE